MLFHKVQIEIYKFYFIFLQIILEIRGKRVRFLMPVGRFH